eukprot:UN27625
MGGGSDIACNSSHLSFEMFCCVGEVFNQLPVSHLSNRTTMLYTMRDCFQRCHESSYMEMFKHYLIAMVETEEQNTTRKSYGNHECTKNIQHRCTESTQPLHVACMLLLVFMFAAALLGNLVVIVSILHTRS